MVWQLRHAFRRLYTQTGWSRRRRCSALHPHRCWGAGELGLVQHAGLTFTLVGEGGLGCGEQRGTRVRRDKQTGYP